MSSSSLTLAIRVALSPENTLQQAMHKLQEQLDKKPNRATADAVEGFHRTVCEVVPTEQVAADLTAFVLSEFTLGRILIWPYPDDCPQSPPEFAVIFEAVNKEYEFEPNDEVRPPTYASKRRSNTLKHVGSWLRRHLDHNASCQLLVQCLDEARIDLRVLNRYSGLTAAMNRELDERKFERLKRNFENLQQFTNTVGNTRDAKQNAWIQYITPHLIQEVAFQEGSRELSDPCLPPAAE